MKKSLDPVLEAVLRKDISSLQLAIGNGAELERKDKGGCTPLVNAVIDDELVFVELLLTAGAAVNVHDKIGFTPLHYAAKKHSAPLVKLLLAAGAEVNAKDEHGNTPLSSAVFESRGRSEVILALIESGANPDLPNNYGVSPRGLANTIANYDVASILVGL